MEMESVNLLEFEAMINILGMKIISKHDHTMEQIKRILNEENCNKTWQDIDENTCYCRIYYNNGKTLLVTLRG